MARYAPLRALLLFSATTLLASAPLLAPTPLYAQIETGSVLGTVTDASGAVVPNAQVVVLNTQTGLTHKTLTNQRGAYQVLALAPGSYRVSIVASGFAPYQQALTVVVGGAQNVNAKLSVGNSSVTVKVNAANAAMQLNTTTSEISTVVSPKEMIDLPSLTRNPYDFVELSGNISSDPNGSTGRGVGYSISGTRSTSTEILLDGVENVDLFDQSVGTQIPLDSVEEYRVITNGFDARYGRASGGVVNLVTKSGTNHFHGSLYEYNRISALAANTYYEDATNYSLRQQGLADQPGDHFTRNQFGYSLGGPVLHDKLFFFSNTEWVRIRSAATQNAVIPTDAFIATTASNVQQVFSEYGKLASNVKVVSPVSVSGFNMASPLEQVTYQVPADASAGVPQNTWMTDERIDFNLGSNTTMFYRYGGYRETDFVGSNSNSPYAGYSTGQTFENQAHLFSITHIFSPNIINTSKVAYSRLMSQQPLGTAPVGPTLYLNQANTASVDGATNLNIALPGYLPFSPGSALPSGGPQNLYQFQDDLSWVIKNHSLHIGGSYIQTRDNRSFGAYENSVEQIAKQGASEAASLKDLQAGSLYQFEGAVDPHGKYPCPTNEEGVVQVSAACTITLPVTAPSFKRNNTFNDGAVYVQDNWKATQKLTLNLGMRWEYYGVQHNHNPNLESNFYLGSGDNIFEQVRNGQVLTTPNSPVGGVMAQQFHNFGPRFGFAYDLSGNGKTVIRGGYGISYERNFGNVSYNIIQNPPNYAVISLVAGVDVPSLSVTANNAGPLAGSGSKALPKTSLRALAAHMPVSYAQQINLSVDHMLTRNTILSIQYSNTRGIHLYSVANINPAYFGNVYLGDEHAGNRLNYQYSNINEREANGDGYYNGLNIHFESRRFSSNGLLVTANYTLSHSLDNLSSTFSESGNNFNVGYLNPFNPSLDRGNSDYDVRHRFVLGGVYEPTLLQFNHRSRWIQAAFGGLEFAPIFTANSGTPFTIYDCTNGLSACPRIVDAPGLKFHGKAVPNGGIDSYNYLALPAASANPYTNPTYKYSDVPTCTSTGCYQNPGLERNQWRSPSDWNLDMGIYKNIKISERVKLQLRGEFYDILNHHNMYVVPGNADFAEVANIQAIKGSPGGSPSASDERRDTQLALRLTF